jgi:hypothetical protein
MYLCNLTGYGFLEDVGDQNRPVCVHCIEIFRQREASNLHHTLVAEGAIKLWPPVQETPWATSQTRSLFVAIPNAINK